MATIQRCNECKIMKLISSNKPIKCRCCNKDMVILYNEQH